MTSGGSVQRRPGVYEKGSGVLRASKECGVELRSLSTWREVRLPITKHQPEICARCSNCLSEQKIIFRNSLSGKRRKAPSETF